MTELTNDKILLRPVVDDDREFLLRVYECSREIELAVVPWDAAMKRAFVVHQFDAQTSHYSTEYPESRHYVIELSETSEPVGRLYVNRTNEQISILDITVLNDFRRRGVGSVVVGDLVEEARSTGRSVQVYVETFNPSKLFFTKRGFTVEGDDGVNVRLVWRINKGDGN